jgi:nucleoside phosphorylase/CheY-like chemotaxis protein
MRVLVVDDDPQKIAAVRAFLFDQGFPATDILEAAHAAGARIVLARSPVEVLLIDVLLPAREGALPLGENSIELLRQIFDDGTTEAPHYILGMTASLEAQEKYDQDFRGLVTQILHVAPGHDAWRESLAALIRLIRRVDAGTDRNDFDVCVLNALRSPELEALYQTWPLELGAEQLLRRNILCRTGTLDLGEDKRRIVCAHLAQMGPVASAHAATALLSEFHPRVLLMTGVCGGFADIVSVGDVVVAEKSWDWQAGKWSDDGVLATSLDQRSAAAELVAAARGAESSMQVLYDQYGGVKPESPPRLVFGPMVTGSSVVASNDIHKVFRTQHRKMAAVDMECYGLYYAAENHASGPVHTVCVKAVSDLADRNKAHDLQGYCSYLSAAVALEILRRYFVPDALQPRSRHASK